MDRVVPAICVCIRDTLGDEEQEQLVSWKVKKATTPLGQPWGFSTHSSPSRVMSI